MNSSRFILRGAVAATLLALVSAAQAGLVYKDYFASQDIGGDLTQATTTVAARTAFSGMLTDQKPTQGFEGFANNTTATDGLVLFGGTTKTLTSSTGKITSDNNDGSGFTGRFNTSACADGAKCKWWDTAYSFTLDFGADDYSAFAFYGTDFSDFGGTVYIELLNSDLSAVKTSILVSGATKDALLDTTGNTTAGTGNGSLLHFGFTDDTQSYGGVRFVVMQADGTPVPNFDYLGFDDLILGNVAAAPPTVPEPATLALVALSLAGLAASRRKKAQPQR